MSNNRYKILTVDPDSESRKNLSALLETAGYKAITANTADEALLLFKSHIPDIVISELFLPDKSGISLIEEIKSISAAPVIILSANSEEKSKVAALDAGADDYITKPYGEAELSARIRASLRASRRYSYAEKSEFSGHNIKIDYTARRVFANNKEIRLTQNEYNILSLLTLNSAKMLTYREIIKAIWGDCYDRGSIKKLQVNISNIRKKLGTEIISNVPGVGYRTE